MKKVLLILTAVLVSSVSFGQHKMSILSGGTDKTHETTKRNTPVSLVEALKGITLKGRTTPSEQTKQLRSINTTPDLVVKPSSFISEYYAVPFEQAIFTPKGNVKNIGQDLTDAVSLGLTITGGYSDAQAITTPLVSGADEELTFASYTATTAGTSTFTYTADYATDADPLNNTFTKDIELGVELVRDNGILDSYIGVGVEGGEIGSVFTINSIDTLTSVKWVMSGTLGDEVTVIVRNFTTAPTTEVGRSVIVTNNNANNPTGEYEAGMDGSIVLQPGTYFIGLIEGANVLALKTTTDPFIAGTAWAHFNNSWNDLGALGYEHTYHIRPQFNNVATTPDLSVTPAGFAAEYYAVPLEQATFVPKGNVENIENLAMGTATDLTDAVNLDLTITGGYSDAQAITTPLANGANEDLAFAPYTASSTGPVTLTYTATYAVDANPSNNTFSKNIEIGTELVRDNGVIASDVGVGLPGGEIGNVFTINSTDTITSVKWTMTGTPGDEVAAIIRNFTTEPTTEVGRSLAVTNNGSVEYESAEYEANMVGLVVLQPGKYFIGLIEDANTVGIEYTTTPYISGTAWAFANNIWYDLGASFDYEHTYHIRPQFNNVSPIANDIGMVSINTVPTMLPGNLNITGTIKNLSTINNLTSFDVVYTIDGGTTSAVYNVIGQSIAPGENFDFTHNIPYEAVIGFHTIEITISNPNGNTDENPSDNVMSKELTVLNEIFPKTVLFEEATGTWCGWCVRGLVGLNTMAQNITDGTWIGIAVHNSDPMAVTEYDNAVGTFISGYPSGVMDRHPIAISPLLSYLEDKYNVRKLEVPLAKAVIDNGTFYPNTREMTIDIESFFALDITSVDYNAAIIVVEDGVTGTSSGWEQANYYHSGNAGPMEDWDGFNYVGAGNPVPAADMVYNHVGRALLGGWSGEAGSIPSSVTYGTGYVHTYTHTLPADQNYDNINLVGIIIDNSNGQIINATEVHAADVLTVGISKVNNSNFSIFPNPTTGLVKVEGIEGAQIIVYNMIGEVVYTEANATATTTIDLSTNSAGNYIVKVINDNEVSTQKIVLTK